MNNKEDKPNENHVSKQYINMKNIMILIPSALATILCTVQCYPEDRVYRLVKQDTDTGDNSLYYPEKPIENIDTGDGFAPEGYELVWSDEFDSPASLSSKWRFEEGGTGWGNEELQYYCADGIYSPTGQETARISDGSLLITAYKIRPSASSDNREYISTRMNSKESWTYGYFEMRAKLPAVRGTWPAFWMLSQDGNYDVSDGGGELDIMEWVGNEPDKVWFSAHCQHVTTGSGEYYRDPATGKDYPHTASIDIVDPGSQFHCFGMEWTHEYVRAFLDGEEYYYAPNPIPDSSDETWWPFDKDYYLKLNLAIGGGWGGDVDPDFSSAVYEIDWVRVFQKNE